VNVKHQNDNWLLGTPSLYPNAETLTLQQFNIRPRNQSRSTTHDDRYSGIVHFDEGSSMPKQSKGNHQQASNKWCCWREIAEC